MELNKFIAGEGLDVSKDKNLDNCKHLFVEPNNLYSLREIAKPESLPFIYSKNLINETKFHRILIKEWFNYCKLGGFIIIEMQDNNLFNKEQLIKECSVLLGDKIEIIEKDESNGSLTLVTKKVKPSLRKDDKISSWTFGILSDGKRQEWVDKEIESIINLKIPNYEIIICGAYNGKYKKRNEVNVIHFDSNVERITRHKNLLCENAKYENLAITHDKIIFDKDWYKGMKEYGNHFEVLSCIIHDNNGKRAGDWITHGDDWNKIMDLGLLDYKDWDKNGYIGGYLYLIKKSVWEKAKFDESLLWNQAEDIKLSKDFYDKGIVARFNPFSKTIMLAWRFDDLKDFEFNPIKLGKMRNRSPDHYWWYTKQWIKRYILGRS